MRLFTSADEVQGLLDWDFSSSAAEYVVIGFYYGATSPNPNPTEEPATDRFQYQANSRCPRTPAVTGNLNSLINKLDNIYSREKIVS